MSLLNLKGKRILFIAPCFHSYENLIISKLNQCGVYVEFYPERDYSFRFKIVNNISCRFLTQYQAWHYRSIYNSIKSKHFDYLLVIRGYKITKEFLLSFKLSNPDAKLIMYQWDSNATNRFDNVIEYFDSVSSFDYRDCRNLHIRYLPLFYNDDILESKCDNSIYLSDFFFMGTYIPERYKALVAFREKYAHKYRINSYIYMATSSRYKEFLKGTHLNRTLISSTHMSRNIYLSMLNGTKVVVDVSSNSQTGLAMRIIEAISMGKKVATSNPYIAEEPFYNPANICIFNANDPIIDDSFIQSPFEGTPHTLSIGQWLENLLLFNI